MPSPTASTVTPSAPPSLAAFAENMRSNYRAAIPLTGVADPVAEVRPLHIPAEQPTRQIAARVYVPMGVPGGETAAKRPIVLFAHGGGFVSGDFDTHDVLARAIANGAQALVVAVDYRLAPEHPFPAGLDDVYAALVWLSQYAHEIGGDAQAIVVAGDSAGGNLVAACAILARDQGGPSILAQWLMYPMLGNKFDTASWQQLGDTNFPTREVVTGVLAAYVPSGTDPCTPLVAPLWAAHAGLPPTLVQVAELDPLRDEGLAYTDLLREVGVAAEAQVYPGQQHGFIQFFKDSANHTEGETALRDGLAFVQKQFALTA